MNQKLFILIFSLCSYSLISAANEAQKTPKKELFRQAFQQQSPINFKKNIDTWLENHVEQAPLSNHDMLVLINMLYISWHYADVAKKSHTILNALCMLSLSIRANNEDLNDLHKRIENMQKLLSLFRQLSAENKHVATLLKHITEDVSQPPSQEVVKVLDELQALAAKDFSTHFNLQHDAVNRSFADFAQLVNSTGDNLKEIAAYHAFILKGQLPDQTPIPEEQKALVKVTLMSELSSVVEDECSNCLSLFTSYETHKNEFDTLHQQLFACAYTNLYQLLLKKNIKPVVIVNTQGHIPAAQQTTVLPAVLN